MAGEVYTPGPSQNSGSLGRSLSYTAGSIALERSTTVHRTMLNGTVDTKNLFRTFFGIKQTGSEMEAFSGGAGQWMKERNWRNKVWGNLKGPMGLKGSTILGTRWAPSSWMMAVDISANSKLGSHNLLNVAEGKAWGAIRPDAVKNAADFAHIEDMYGPSRARNFPFKEHTYDPSTRRLAGAEANRVIDSFMGFGKDYKGNPVKNLMNRAWYKPNAGIVNEARTAAQRSVMPGPWTNEALEEGAKKIGWLRQMSNEGALIGKAGTKGIEGVTAGATVARGVYGAVGIGLKAYGYASMGYYAGKAAYKGWELFNIKAPMAAYKSVGAQLGRASFSSGDASLLTGIPANNRMRAVQAIQGSRMNARTALGGEAALFAGHFG